MGGDVGQVEDLLYLFGPVEDLLKRSRMEARGYDWRAGFELG